MEKEKIANTIRKLLRLERAGVPESVEAGIEARRLMEKHCIEVTLEEERKLRLLGIVGVQWRERLLSVIARLGGCCVLQTKKGDALLVGYESDVVHVRVEYERIVTELLVAAHAGWKNYYALRRGNETPTALDYYFPDGSIGRRVAGRISSAFRDGRHGAFDPRPFPRRLAASAWFYAFLDLAANTAADKLLGSRRIEPAAPVAHALPIRDAASSAAEAARLKKTLSALDAEIGRETDQLIAGAEAAGRLLGARIQWTPRKVLLLPPASVAFAPAQPRKRRQRKAPPAARTAEEKKEPIELEAPSRWTLIEID